jgi:hypothetical protein
MHLLRATRLPPGGPEACIEAFANIYRQAAPAIRAEVKDDWTPKGVDFPTLDHELKAERHGGSLLSKIIVS